ncbi:succinate dehydrogenase cytochrome b subunit [soil metagenome]
MPAASGSAPRRGAWLRETWESSVGKKVIVAITGSVLVLYVIAHMLGNLKALQGAGVASGSIDAYAEWLRTVGEPVIPREGVLWTVRAILLFSFVVHVVGVLQLAGRNRAARPVGHRPPVIKRSFSSRTMQAGGLFLLAFVVFHILHFTTGTITPSEWTEGAVFQNLDNAFDSPLLVAIYLAAPIALGLHLRHAVWSSIQTAGWDKPNRNPTIRRLGTFIAVAVTVGFMAIPLAFYLEVLP